MNKKILIAASIAWVILFWQVSYVSVTRLDEAYAAVLDSVLASEAFMQ